MSDFLIMILVGLAYFALMKWVLPRLGMPT